MSMSTDVRIALVFQQAEGSAALRTALANAGVIVAAETRADAIDQAALEAADVDAIVVNVDPELEELLDEVMERLDGLSQPVIYNDPAASSDLSGWDRARWLRHLSAKVKGGGSLVPPPPPGAQPVPMPPPRVPEPAKVVEAPVAALAVPAAAAAMAPSPVDDEAAPQPAADGPAGDLALDLDLLFVDAVQADAPVPVADPVAEPAMPEPVVDLDALFDHPPEDEAAPPPPAPAESTGADADFDALFMAAPPSADGDGARVALADLDALFADASSAATDENPLPAATTPAAKGAVEAEIDLSSLLGDFDLDQIPGTSPVASPAPAPAPEWSLDEGLIETSARDDSTDQGIPAPAPRDESVSSHVGDLDDLDALFAEASVTDGPAPQAVSEVSGLEELDLGSVEFEFESVAADTPVARSAEPAEGDALAMAEFDFGFDLEPLGEPPAVSGSADLDPLEALFAAPVAAAATGAELALPDLDRLYVLGGSIGGPEAMKAFLARLPAGLPAAFVIAQHMGAEFLQMMAAQLDAATALSVRFPKAGERLRHGEAVVAPSDQRLSIDDSGHVQLQPASGASPYSPSIDQLVSDAIERLGDRVTLILFSGMGSDGLEGARQLIARGGQVWVQERSSCVVASMIDGVKSQGLVRFEGSPAELADRVLEVLS